MLLEITLNPTFVGKVVGIAAFIGIILPMVQAILTPWHLAPKVKVAISVGFAIIGGFAGYIVQNGLNFTDLPSLGTWIVGAFAAIRVFYQPLNAAGVIPALENTGVGSTGNTDADVEDDLHQFEDDDLPPDPYAGAKE